MIERLIRKHGKDAIMFTDSGYNNCELTIKGEEHDHRNLHL
jgi:hypothetical protein